MARRPAFVYEDFTQSPPSESMRKQHQEGRNQVMRERFQKQARQLEQQRRQTEPYLRALTEFLAVQDAFKDLSSKRSPADKPEHKSVKLTIPNAPRLRKRIFRTGSCITIDPPSPLEPFISWTGTAQSPGIGGSAQASSDAATGVVKCSSAGGANYNIYGNATCWGYVGKYYGSPQNLPAGHVGQVVISSSPTATYQAIENITSFLGAGGGAGLTAQTSIWVPVYDSNWNHLADYNTLPVNMIEPNTINIAAPLDAWSPTFTYPLTLTVPLESGMNVGVFVEFYVYAWGSGGSTGSWDFVGTASIDVHATVPSITLEVQEWVPD